MNHWQNVCLDLFGYSAGIWLVFADVAGALGYMRVVIECIIIFLIAVITLGRPHGNENSE